MYLWYGGWELRWRAVTFGIEDGRRMESCYLWCKNGRYIGWRVGNYLWYRGWKIHCRRMEGCHEATAIELHFSFARQHQSNVAGDCVAINFLFPLQCMMTSLQGAEIWRLVNSFPLPLCTKALTRVLSTA
jgi:hypothetical protein